MRITDLLDKRSISLDAVCASKSDALDQAVALMVKSGKINDEEAYRKQVYLREEESTTGIGEGIAIPHGKCDAVSKPGLAAMVVPDGVDYVAFDGSLANLIFMIAAPEGEADVHLEALSRLSNSVRTLDQMVALNEKRLQDLEQELKKEKEKNEEKTDHHRM